MVPGGSRPSDTDIRDLLAELFNLVYTVKNRFWANTRFLFFGPIYKIRIDLGVVNTLSEIPG